MVSQYKLSVCPHDTAKNLLGWFTLNTYLQRKLGTGIHFEPQDNFLIERKAVLEQEHHVVVYANPYSALCFARDKGFVPVARPVNVVDETIVVARAGAEVPAAPRIASATDKLIIHNLGLKVLERVGIDSGASEFKFVGNHLNAAKAVLQGEADLLDFVEVGAEDLDPDRRAHAGGQHVDARLDRHGEGVGPAGELHGAVHLRGQLVPGDGRLLGP